MKFGLRAFGRLVFFAKPVGCWYIGILVQVILASGVFIDVAKNTFRVVFIFWVHFYIFIVFI